MVAVEPSYCHQCGTELTKRRIDGRTRKVCPGCGHRHFVNAVPAVTVVVARGDEVLLIEQSSGDRWEVPGGHLEREEEPTTAAARELGEEAGVEADPEDLELASALHSTHGDRHYTMITYAVDRAATGGEPSPGDEAAAVDFWSTDRIFGSPDRTREVDRRILERVLDGDA